MPPSSPPSWPAGSACGWRPDLGQMGGQKMEWIVVGTVIDLSSTGVYVSRPLYASEVGLTGRGTTAYVGTLPDDGATQLRVENHLREALECGLRVSGTNTYESSAYGSKVPSAPSRCCC